MRLTAVTVLVAHPDEYSRREVDSIVFSAVMNHTPESFGIGGVESSVEIVDAGDDTPAWVVDDEPSPRDEDSGSH